LKNKTSKLNN